MKLSHVNQLFIFITLLAPAALSAQDSEAPRIFDYGRQPGSGAVIADSLPARWVQDDAFRQDLPTEDGWWRRFRDPVLDSLIQIGVDNNFNVLTAIRRMELAHLALMQTRAGYLPTIAMDASWTKSRSSGAMTSPTTPAHNDSYFDIGLSMNWQIDIFGRIARRSKADKARFDATRAEYAATMVSLCADIATAYVQLRVYRAEEAVAVAHLASQKKVLDITKARFECGLASMLDVQQATTVLASTQATIPGLESSIHSTENRIATLIAVSPADARRILSTPAPIPPYKMLVQTGVPMDLLRRRPDVVQAEREVQAMAAEIGVAKSDYLPLLELNASIGTAARDAGDLFTDRSFTYSVVPSLSWTLFDALQRKYNVASARQNMEIALDSYNATLLQAVTETDNAMVSYLDTLRQIESLQEAAEASRKSLELSLDLYKRGLAAFTNVADAQMDYLTYTNSVLVAQGNAVAALIQIYQALGGGWAEP